MADIIRLSGVPFQAALLSDFLPLPLHNLRQLFRKAIAVRIEEQTAAEILIFGDIIADFSNQNRFPCAVFKVSSSMRANSLTVSSSNSSSKSNTLL